MDASRAGASARDPGTDRRRLRRDVGRTALLFASLGSIIGSGWLFASLFAAQLAGPAALISWLIAGFAVLLIALIYSELGGMYPRSGGPARFPHYSHGSIVGFTAGWMFWIATVTIAPIEVEAALQYATNYLHGLTHTNAAGVITLSGPGYAVAAVLLVLFTLVNLWGVSRMAKTNAAIVWWKVAVPIVTLAALFVVGFHGSNLTADGGFAPFGLKGILEALSAGGVIFAIVGFEQAVQLGGESTNPRRNIPFAVIGSLLIGGVIYILLQLSFLGALSHTALSKGWSHVDFKGLFGPFAGLATGLGLSWLAVLLYIDAVVSPLGTGLIYTGTSARVSYALGRNRYVPRPFEMLSRRGVPLVSILFSFVVGMLLLIPFPGWQEFVGFISSAIVLAYGLAPLALVALRREDPDRERPFRLPAAGILAPLGFVVANLIVLFAGWLTDWKLFAAVGMGFVLFAFSYATNPARRPHLDWGPVVWLLPYLGGMALLSYLSSFDGKGTLPMGWDMLAVAAWSVLIYAAALRTRLPAEHVRATIEAQEREEAEVGGAPREPVVRVPEAEPRTAGVTTGSAERAPAGARSRSFRPGAPS